jgi:NAD(P)-dependent dehydrogenase (short-subunit alcohol dehydrogenase family)
MLAGGGGAIVNTSSTAALTALPGGALYSASKHAVLGMTRGAALDYAKSGIRVNAVNPSAADTPMVRRFIERTGRDPAAAIPMGRLATAEEVAEAVLWLCSDRSSFVTGQPLVVDGGFTAQ